MIDKESKYNYNENEDYNYSNTHQNINGKFEFQFGTIWTAFMFIFTIIIIFSSIESFNLMAIPFLGMFWYIGIYLLKSGLRKMKADAATEDFGEECFGRICELSSTGSTNGNTFYRATIIAYLPKEGIVKTFQEDIGYNYYEFPEGSYLRLKYFQDDVNIKEIINENIIPEKVRNRLVMLEEQKVEKIYSNSNFNTQVYNSDMLHASKIISGVFLNIFGIIWLSITAFMTYAFYGTQGNIVVNGELVTTEEFSSMLFPKIFFGIFWIIGISTMLGGIILCFKKEKNIDKESNNLKEYEDYEENEYNNYKNINIANDNDDNFDPIQRR